MRLSTDRKVMADGAAPSVLFLDDAGRFDSLKSQSGSRGQAKPATTPPKKKGGRGGYRPGAGRKKGSAPVTLDKVLAREHIRQRVVRALDPLLDAQIANAQGLKYLVTREKKTGKFVRVTQAMARVKQGDKEEIIEVWEKDPSVQAFTDLMNRAFDKPADQLPEPGEGVTEAIYHWRRTEE